MWSFSWSLNHSINNDERQSSVNHLIACFKSLLRLNFSNDFHLSMWLNILSVALLRNVVFLSRCSTESLVYTFNSYDKVIIMMRLNLAACRWWEREWIKSLSCQDRDNFTTPHFFRLMNDDRAASFDFEAWNLFIRRIMMHQENNNKIKCTLERILVQ